MTLTCFKWNRNNLDLYTWWEDSLSLKITLGCKYLLALWVLFCTLGIVSIKQDILHPHGHVTAPNAEIWLTERQVGNKYPIIFLFIFLSHLTVCPLNKLRYCCVLGRSVCKRNLTFICKVNLLNKNKQTIYLINTRRGEISNWFALCLFT